MAKANYIKVSATAHQLVKVEAAKRSVEMQELAEMAINAYLSGERSITVPLLDHQSHSGNQGISLGDDAGTPTANYGSQFSEILMKLDAVLQNLAQVAADEKSFRVEWEHRSEAFFDLINGTIIETRSRKSTKKPRLEKEGTKSAGDRRQDRAPSVNRRAG